LTITVTAAASFGTVAKVEFYNGATKLDEITSPPYVFVWKNAAAGTYDIKIVAYDNKGTSVSKTVSVTVTEGTLVLIDGGNFTLGDDTNAKATPAHPVTLSSYYINKYELTFAEYDAFTTATGRALVEDVNGAGRGNKPLYNISWYDAIEYCNWRSAQESLTPVYTIDKTTKDPNNCASDKMDDKKWIVTSNLTADGYRLPTEAEWEFAAKGGTKSKGFIYSGSNDVSEVAWYGGKAVAANTGAGNVTKKGDLRAIGSLKANELGVYDMSGNVHEWVWDKYDTNRPGYANSQAGQTETNPTGITGTYNKFVFRGGNSGGPAACMLVNKRFIKDPTFTMCPAGIRLARSR
jgi:formylglycine-generating enzyme required for sulfatase activity